MKVLLNGGVARHGIDILSKRFGDRISLRQTAETDAAWIMAENMKWAEVLISVDYGPEMPQAPNLKSFLVPASGLDAIDLETVPAAAAICNVYEHEIAIAEYTFNGMLE